MERNNITAAPQAADFGKAYAGWLTLHAGSREDFLAFMTTPSAGRDAFVRSCAKSFDFDGTVMTVTIQ